MAKPSDWRASTPPTPGWKGAPRPTMFVNPRAPGVPATLELTLEEYFQAAALIGLLSAQQDEPDMEWIEDWSARMGALMASKARARRPKP